MGGKTFRGGAKITAAAIIFGCAGIAHAADRTDLLDTSNPSQTADSQTAPEAQPAGEALPVAPAEQPASSKKWQFATIGYVWFAGAWGKTDVIGPAAPVDLSLPFGKVLKAFKFAFMGAAEAQHDRIVILGDLTFIHLDTHKGIGIRDPDFLQAELDSRTAEITLLGGYRVADKGPVMVDLLAGGRMNFFKTTLQLEGPNRELDGSVKQTWFDPLIGFRARAPLGGKWGASVYGDLGGFGVGSHITWQGVAGVDYQINHKMSVGAGWRYFKVDRRDGDFLYNVHQSGPLITFRTVL